MDAGAKEFSEYKFLNVATCKLFRKSLVCYAPADSSTPSLWVSEILYKPQL